MIYFALRAKYTPKDDTVFRSVGVSPECMDAMTDWRFSHQQGRDISRSLFKGITFEWRDSKKKPIADFPPSGESGGVYSEAATQALRHFLEPNGDLYPLPFKNDEIKYFLFDCHTFLESTPNEGFNILDLTTLKTLKVEGRKSEVPHFFESKSIASSIVSEAFKNAAESAGLTGMDFIPVEIVTKKNC